MVKCGLCQKYYRSPANLAKHVGAKHNRPKDSLAECVGKINGNEVYHPISIGQLEDMEEE